MGMDSEKKTQTTKTVTYTIFTSILYTQHTDIIAYILSIYTYNISVCVYKHKPKYSGHAHAHTHIQWGETQSNHNGMSRASFFAFMSQCMLWLLAPFAFMLFLYTSTATHNADCVFLSTTFFQREKKQQTNQRTSWTHSQIFIIMLLRMCLCVSLSLCNMY